ncbi:Nucleolar protein 9 [Sergentomyia squamirostris]
MNGKQIKRKHVKKSVKNYLRSKEHISNEDVSDEDANYFLGILNVLSEEADPENKKLLAGNVIEFTRGREVILASHQIASKVIENLLEFADDAVLSEYQVAFKEDIRTLCANRFSSHVLEKLIKVSAEQFLTQSGSNEPPGKKITLEQGGLDCKSFVESCSKFLMNNMEEFVWDSYANHVIRTCLKSLSGICREEVAPLTVPEEWTVLVKEYASRLRDWPFFPDFPYQELTSGLLQTLISALGRIDKNALKLIGAFFTEPQPSEDDDSKLHKLFTTESSIRFLEALIALAGKKLFSKILLRLFQGNLRQLSLMKSANFCVQKILEHVKTQEEFNLCFIELQEHFGEILQAGHTGVILMLCQTCHRLDVNQNQFIKSLRMGLSCPKEGNLALCALKLKPHEMVEKDDSTFVHIHGSLILQEMLNFRKPIEIVQQILKIHPDKFINLLNTSKGSFIADAFFTSVHIGEKSRIAFVNHLQGFLVDMATGKFGSRCLERLFEASSDDQRSRIVAELAEKINKMQSTQFGFIVSKKLRVMDFKQNPKRWNSMFKGNKKSK